MMLKRSTTESKPSAMARLVRAGVATLAAAGSIAALATGCLDRPVAGAEPSTSNVFVDQIVQTAVDKIDLLFMIDNSVSMADKQDILKSAVPLLLRRLVTPNCLDAQGNATGAFVTNGVCANGSTPEFAAIGDIHIGVVTSSLGSHGGDVCSMPSGTDDHLDDQAHLIGSVRTGVTTWNNSGFLAWDQTGTKNNPPGTTNAATLNTDFSNMISAVGEHGCGYEASLESWYRFLVDPEPPDSVKFDAANNITVRSSKINVDPTTNKAVLDANGKTTCVGCDTTLLAQRAAFLRPDSLVAIVMLSDENDCSIRDDTVGWFVGSSRRMPRATSQCAANPNDPCCRSCAQNETTPPAGCMPLASDSVCSTKGTAAYATWDAMDDSLNLRCYNQHQRFGFDLLYETGRYVNALKATTIPLQSNPNVYVTNPLYDSLGSDKGVRDQSLVFLAGIIGVPWQDIADDASLTGAGLTYLTADELNAKDRWTQLLGSPTASPPVPPSDPFMIESILDRTTLPAPSPQVNTIANVKLVSSKSNNPKENVINGHEQNIPGNDDLQYACIFPLTSRPCAEGDSACDCSPAKGGDLSAIMTANSPLCQPPTGGTAGATQSFAKAYPGARELQVLKDFGKNAIVASICPKIATDTTAADYGYNPAVGAIIERLKDALKGKCLPRPLAIDPTSGQVLCKVIEAQKSGCDCTQDGRAPADAAILGPVQAQLRENGYCDVKGSTDPACTTWCECEIKQEDATNLRACQGNDPSVPAGYCYVDAAPLQPNVANPPTTAQAAEIQSALAKCPTNQQQLLRFIPGANGVQTPAQGSVAFIACVGATVEPVTNP